jgi:hypothetical protein
LFGIFVGRALRQDWGQRNHPSSAHASPTLSLAVRTAANSVTVRAFICAHSSRATKTVHCTVLIMWHSSLFVKEGRLVFFGEGVAVVFD